MPFVNLKDRVFVSDEVKAKWPLPGTTIHTSDKSNTTEYQTCNITLDSTHVLPRYIQTWRNAHANKKKNTKENDDNNDEHDHEVEDDNDDVHVDDDENTAQTPINDFPHQPLSQLLFSAFSSYADVFYSNYSAQYSHKSVLDCLSLHVLNHIMKSRNQILKNNNKITKATKAEAQIPECRDQGFTRPKVTIIISKSITYCNYPLTQL